MYAKSNILQGPCCCRAYVKSMDILCREVNETDLRASNELVKFDYKQNDVGHPKERLGKKIYFPPSDLFLFHNPTNGLLLFLLLQ